MRICALIKYPPIQGGVSAQGYWMARGLAARGHQVHVVTNAFEVEDEYRLRLAREDHDWLTADFSDGGGRVRLHTPEPFSPKLTHIPQANPFVSKLAGLATRVVREHDCQVLFAYYLEPNGVAAALAAHWTDRPYVVQHAGSDLGRLMKHPGLDVTYTEVFRRAAGICSGSPYTFLGMGVDQAQIYRHPPFHLPRDVFTPDGAPLDIDEHIADVRARMPDAAERIVAPGPVDSPQPLDRDVPTIGIYGKLGDVKGSFDLLEALAQLRAEGRRFNFVAVTSGRDNARYRRRVEELGLSPVTWILPFMAHWRVAGFLRACTAVCFLERDFPIKFHGPTIPREVLSCGTCLILSGEIQAKQPYRHWMVDGENYLLVEDPKVHDDLARALRRVLDDPEAARAIGRRGAEMIDRAWQAREGAAGDADLDDLPDVDDQAAVYEEIFEDVIERAAGRPSRLGPSARGLEPDRESTLRRLAAPLVAALDEAEIDGAIDAHLEQQPDPGDPIVDARAFCRAHESGDHRAVAEAARYARHLLWLGSWSPSAADDHDDDHDASDHAEDAHPRFARADVLPERGAGSWSPELIRGLAPLATAWLRIETFAHLEGRGDQQIVFHKVPSLTGRHFGVNQATATVLEACDGTASVDGLVERFSAGRGRREVARALFAMMRRFYREGLIVFVDPSPHASETVTTADA